MKDRSAEKKVTGETMAAACEYLLALDKAMTVPPWHVTGTGDNVKIIQTAHVTRDVWTIPHTEADTPGIAESRNVWPAVAKYCLQLLRAVTKHHAQPGDDRCWIDDDDVYAAAGLSPVDRRVGDKAAMRKNCDRFIENRCEAGGPWKSYAELEAELREIRENLQSRVTRARDALARCEHQCAGDDEEPPALAMWRGVLAEAEACESLAKEKTV